MNFKRYGIRHNKNDIRNKELLDIFERGTIIMHPFGISAE